MKKFISEILEVEFKENIILKESRSVISESLNYHLENNLGISNSIYRYASNKHLELINEVRELYNSNSVLLCEKDEELIKSDAGYFGIFEGEKVVLDLPFEEYEENLEEGKKNNKNKVESYYPKHSISTLAPIGNPATCIVDLAGNGSINLFSILILLLILFILKYIIKLNNTYSKWVFI